MKMLDCAEVNPKKTAECSVVWLHGLGADGYDFVPVAEQLELPAPTRYIFPHAPVRPVSLNGGMKMHAWYDIGNDASSSLADILQSVAQVKELVQREVERGVPSEKILLAGFSQGGVVAQHLALRHPKRLAGLLALSTYMPHLEDSQAEFSPHSKELSFLAMHGTQDAMIPIHRSRGALQGLMTLGYEVQWKEYDMAHSVCPEQIRDINCWMQERFKSALAA